VCGGGPRRPSRRRRMTTPPTTTLAPTTATTTTRFDRRTELGDCSPPFPFILSRIWKMQLWYPREMHLYQHKASSLRLAAVFLSPHADPGKGLSHIPANIPANHKHPCTPWQTREICIFHVTSLSSCYLTHASRDF